ncbi:MAG: DUF4160 domain-containing protein [Bacteriovoracaceae bacterium]|nr:DUF4160 domain-containing protein [Bacteriovoracaceae bacterium]
MPRISEIFGIAVYMYWYDNKKHKCAHIHAIFAGRQVVMGLDGQILAGSIGKRGDNLVLEFVKERNQELNEAWNKATNGEELPWIKPIS